MTPLGSVLPRLRPHHLGLAMEPLRSRGVQLTNTVGGVLKKTSQSQVRS